MVGDKYWKKAKKKGKYVGGGAGCYFEILKMSTGETRIGKIHRGSVVRKGNRRAYTGNT